MADEHLRAASHRAFAHRGFGYLAEQDRFLSARETPQFGFAVIGCGIMGQEHVRNTILEGRAEVVGLYDPAAQSLACAQKVATDMGAPVPRAYASVDELCADEQVDAVFICSPNHTHLQVLQQVSQVEKAIFVEKPIATDVADACAVVKLLEAHGRVVRIGLQYRYKAVYQEAIAEVFNRGAVGSVKSVAMVEHRFPFLDKVGQWNKFNKFTGGTLIEKCCHYFDLINLFAQSKPKRVFAIGSQAVNFRDFEYQGVPADGLDQAAVTIEYANGVLGSFNLSMFVPGSREELTVCGDGGRLSAAESAQFGEVTQNRVELWMGDRGVSRRVEPKYPAYIHNAGHHGSTFYEHVAFVDDMIKGKNSGPTPEDALWSILVGAAAQQSIASGRPVEVAALMD